MCQLTRRRCRVRPVRRGDTLSLAAGRARRGGFSRTASVDHAEGWCDHARRRRKVHRARTRAFETGSGERVPRPRRAPGDPGVVATFARRSAPSRTSTPSCTTRTTARTRRLFAAAEPVLRALAESLAGFHAGVLLADKDANIVQRWVADSSILPDLDRICSTPASARRRRLSGPTASARSPSSVVRLRSSGPSTSPTR